MKISQLQYTFIWLTVEADHLHTIPVHTVEADLHPTTDDLVEGGCHSFSLGSIITGWVKYGVIISVFNDACSSVSQIFFECIHSI